MKTKTMQIMLDLIKNIGLPTSLLLLILYRVDHYIKRHFSTFNNISHSLDKLTAEIKNIKYYIHAKEPPHENHRPNDPV